MSDNGKVDKIKGTVKELSLIHICSCWALAEFQGVLEVAATWLELAELVSAWLLWLLVDEDVWACLLYTSFSNKFLPH